MFDDKLKLSVDILREEIKVQRDNMREQWRLYEELRKKVYGLYKLDKHDTLRPKVDILDDDVFRDIRSMETDIYELQEKVEKLEKNKK